MRWIIRTICLGVVRFFYRQIEANGEDRFPADGPLMIVANHPNGLMDPIVIQLCIDRPVGFLAKSTLFENPVGRIAMEAFHALPVYRRRDGNDTSKNESMFAACADTLAQGGGLMLFPEGTSHSDPILRPLKTGAARIALSSMADRDLDELTIVPVGLLYEAKDVFRSRVAVAAGKPIRVSEFMSAYQDDDRATVHALMTRIADHLRDVVLEAEDGEMWRGFVATARATDSAAAEDIAACERRARELSEAFARLIEDEPDEANRLREKTRHYVRMLDTLGFEHPFLLEDAPTKFAVVSESILLILLAPLALVGAILGGPTYKALGPLARRMSGTEFDLVSTIKTIGGLVLLPLTFLVEGLVVGWFFGWPAGLAVFSAGFIFGRLALWWSERVRTTREAVSSWWLRMSSRHTAIEVLARRDELVREIDARLSRPSPGG